MDNKKLSLLFICIIIATILLYICQIKVENIFSKITTNITQTENIVLDTNNTSTEKTKEEITEIKNNSTTESKTETTSSLETKKEVKKEEPKPVSKLPEYETVYATSNVNMRSSDTSGSLKINMIKTNESAYKIFSYDNNWDIIKYNNQIGFVSSKYLKSSNNNIKTIYTHSKQNDIVITTTNLNFRIGPTVESQKISSFTSNTELEVIAKVDNGWLLVKNNGILGYVHGAYTTSILDRAKTQYPNSNLTELNIKKVVYSTTKLNIRNGNDTNNEKIGELEKYESVRVLKEYNDWYFIMTNDYTFGFINKEYTKTLSDIYVIVDISKQRLYMYNDNILYYQIPVTTGKDSTPSDIGLFKVYAKQRDTYLMNNSFVNYWMPYNRGEGLHDASWHNIFGTQNYKTGGSHGCVNIPPSLTDEVYENVSVGTKVLVHK